MNMYRRIQKLRQTSKQSSMHLREQVRVWTGRKISVAGRRTRCKTTAPPTAPKPNKMNLQLSLKRMTMKGVWEAGQRRKRKALCKTLQTQPPAHTRSLGRIPRYRADTSPTQSETHSLLPILRRRRLPLEEAAHAHLLLLRLQARNLLLEQHHLRVQQRTRRHRALCPRRIPVRAYLRGRRPRDGRQSARLDPPPVRIAPHRRSIGRRGERWHRRHRRRQRVGPEEE